MVPTRPASRRRVTFMGAAPRRAGRPALYGDSARILVNSGRGGNGRARLGARQRRLGLRAHLRVAEEQLPPLGRLAPPLEDAAVDQRPAVEVVVQDRKST